MSLRIDGVLLAFHRPVAGWFRDASTVTEHLTSFRRHSRFPLWELNTDTGFPSGLEELEFAAVVLHYSIFGMGLYWLDERWRSYLKNTSAYKVAFFQDECTRCHRRFGFLNDHAIDCVYTCLEPSEFPKVYGRYTNVPRLETNIPGYVSEDLSTPRAASRCPTGRTVDVGYSGRPLPPISGMGRSRSTRSGCVSPSSRRRAGYGWTSSVRRGTGSTGMTGTASSPTAAACSGSSRACRPSTSRTRSDRVHRNWSANKGSGDRGSHLASPVGGQGLLPDDQPRHFEAAAFRICQVLFEGRYSGVLEPMVHYIPLKKDFSNIDEVIRHLGIPEVRGELTENAYRDLIASGDWSYRRFVHGVDTLLGEAGVAGEVDVRGDRGQPDLAAGPASGTRDGSPSGGQGECSAIPAAPVHPVRPPRHVACPAPAGHTRPG